MAPIKNRSILVGLARIEEHRVVSFTDRNRHADRIQYKAMQWILKRHKICLPSPDLLQMEYVARQSLR